MDKIQYFIDALKGNTGQPQGDQGGLYNKNPLANVDFQTFLRQIGNNAYGTLRNVGTLGAILKAGIKEAGNDPMVQRLSFDNANKINQTNHTLSQAPEDYKSWSLGGEGAQTAGNLIGDPLSYLGLGGPTASAVKAGARELAPTVGKMAENYMFDSGLALSAIPKEPSEKLIEALTGKKQATNLDRQLRRLSEAKLAEKKISGAPLGVVTPADEAVRRKSYTDQVLEGIGGRNWYDDSGQKIHFLTGENSDLSNKVAETFGITSQSTGVPANTAFAIKGHNQAMAGMPINTGRFPVPQGADIADVYSPNNGMATGLKRSPFADQIAVGGDFYEKPAGQAHRSVHDIWDGEAFGYVNPDGTPLRRGFSPAEHNWMDTQTNKIINNANKNQLGGFTDWTPGRTQAASWTGAKIRAGDIRPDEAAYSYADAIPLNYAQQSREAVTGKTTDHNIGMLNAPLDVRQAYDDAITNAFYDPKGRDEISKAYGLLTDKSFAGPGIFEGNINPGRQSLVAVGRATGSPLMDDASQALLNATESNYGLLTGQDAAAWSQLAPNKVSAISSDRVGINLGNTIDNDSMMRLNDFNNSLQHKYNLEDPPFALVPSPTGVNIINMGLPNSHFQSELKNISNTLGANKSDIRFAQGSNNYIPQDWKNTKVFGESNYVKNIENIQKSRENAGLYSAFDKVSPGLAAKINEIDKQFGFELSPYIMTMRQAIADNGIAGLRELIKKGEMPAALLTGITPFLEEKPKQ